MKRSKRFFGFALSVALMCSLTTAFASQTASVDTTSADNDGIQRRATSFSFQLAANEMKQSSETYNIQDEDATLTITSMTWDFGAQELLVGWYNIVWTTSSDLQAVKFQTSTSVLTVFPMGTTGYMSKIMVLVRSRVRYDTMCPSKCSNCD